MHSMSGGGGGGGGGDKDNEEELVSSDPNQRNWKGISIAVLVIAAVLALIVTSVVLLTPPDDGPRIKGSRFTLQDILGHEFMALHFNGSWISGEEMVFRDQWGGISVFNAANLTARSIMTNQTYKRLNPAKFELSPDQRYILLANNVKKMFRYTHLAQYSIYDVSTAEVSPLSPVPDVDPKPYLLYVTWAPRGTGLVMVYNNDIYYRPSPKSDKIYRVTTTGVPGIISNGVPDWLYEEEILGNDQGLWMSNDGHLLLYATFNDTNVQEQRFPVFMAQEDKPLYPHIESLRYPKAGTPNPTVNLWVADLADPTNMRIREVKPPVAFKENTEYYFTSISWVSVTEVVVVWMNRPQNVSITTVCKSPSWFCQETQRMSGEGKGWVDIQDSPIFSPDSLSYVTMAPVLDGKAGYYKHIVLVNITKKRTTPLTLGQFDVERILAWDHADSQVYYLGIPENRPAELHLYRASTLPPKIGVPLGPAHCLTCAPDPPPSNVHPYSSFGDRQGNSPDEHEWSEESENEESPQTTTPLPPHKHKKKTGHTQRTDTLDLLLCPCLYHNVIFSPSLAYYVLECLGPGVPTVKLFMTRSRPVPKLLAYMQNNTRLVEKASLMALPQIKTFPVQISGGYHAQVRLHLPPGLREEEITRYPLVVQVYGGPGNQLVSHRWRLDWNTYLAGNRDFIIAQIDGRGSGGQGYQLLHEVYMRLGTVEVADQLEVTEYLRDSLHFVDKRRVAIWGWSYGGFVTSMALAREQDVFQCGIAVAPVTTWKLYDSAYTERYMGLPNATGNYKGYEESDVSARVEYLKDKMFYLVHGTADDNVHFQQSVVLAKALASKGILYRQQVYPDETHTLEGVKKHLYRSMATFLDDCFRKQVPPDLKAGLRNGGTGSE